MSKFKREDRYIVIKRSDLKNVPAAYRIHLVAPIFSLLHHLPRRECLVIESDWPEYGPAWAAIEARATGSPLKAGQGEAVAWRDHSVNYAKGEKCPATIETLQAAWDRDQELMLEQKNEISELKETINQLRQRRTTPPSIGQGEAVAWMYTEKTPEGFEYRPDFSVKRWVLPHEGYEETPLYAAPPAPPAPPASPDAVSVPDDWVCGNCGSNVQTRLDDGAQQKEVKS